MKTNLLKGKNYYENIKKGKIKIIYFLELIDFENSIFSPEGFKLFQRLIRASFVLWLFESIRDVIMKFLGRDRFTTKEKVNTVLRVCVCITTFPNYR